MNPTVLVVDDDSIMLQLLSLVLAKHHYTPVIAPNVEAALDLINAAPPDLVICDLMIPETSGMVLLEHCQADPDLQTIPMIMISAIGDEALFHQARMAGAYACLTKPFHHVELLELMGEALSQQAVINDKQWSWAI